jgi:hypothetical protein
MELSPNSIMTGKEKIQLVHDTLDHYYKALVSGNTVTLSSRIYFLEIENSELLQILDMFVAERRIKYTITDKSEELFKGVPITDSLVPLTFEITILDDFYTAFEAKTPAEKTPNLTRDRVEFDARTSRLSYGLLTCDITDESLEHYTCKLAFKNRKLGAKEDDILEHSVKSQDSQRAVKDATVRINKRAKDAFGIEQLLVFRAGKVRIKEK